MIQGIYLKLFVPEKLRIHGDLLYEWILKQAELVGIPGGSAVRAMAGFGRHGHLHEQHFFELAGNLPIILEFFASADAINQLLLLLESEKQSLYFIKFNAEAGQTVAN
jgi:PII-like signaling protein